MTFCTEIIGFFNNMIELVQGDLETINIFIIIIAAFGMIIIKHMLTSRERRQNKKVVDKSIVGWIQTAKKERTYIDMLLCQYVQWGNEICL